MVQANLQQFRAWLVRSFTKARQRAKSRRTRLSGPRIGPAAGGDPKQLVVLLHGRGANGADLTGVAHLLAKTLPHAAFVLPDAPQRCYEAPDGFEWFRVPGPNRDADKVEAGVRSVAPALNAFIDEELAAHGLSDNRLALFGFSQGCMMALHVGLRRPNVCAAILGYSGRLCAADRLAHEIVSRPPVLLCHGTDDWVVPFDSQQLAATALGSTGVSVTLVERPGLGHRLDRRGIDAGAAFLARALAS